MVVHPYLQFEGRAEEAITFYTRALGAKVEMMMRFSESPEPPPEPMPPGTENKIMHATFRIGESVVMASDGACSGRGGFQGFCLSLTVESTTEAQRVFAALGEGGQVQMPLTKTFFSPSFGMLCDRFGVSWIIYVVSK